MIVPVRKLQFENRAWECEEDYKYGLLYISCHGICVAMLYATIRKRKVMQVLMQPEKEKHKNG